MGRHRDGITLTTTYYELKHSLLFRVQPKASQTFVRHNKHENNSAVSTYRAYCLVNIAMLTLGRDAFLFTGQGCHATLPLAERKKNHHVFLRFGVIDS